MDQYAKIDNITKVSSCSARLGSPSKPTSLSMHFPSSKPPPPSNPPPIGLANAYYKRLAEANISAVELQNSRTRSKKAEKPRAKKNHESCKFDNSEEIYQNRNKLNVEERTEKGKNLSIQIPICPSETIVKGFNFSQHEIKMDTSKTNIAVKNYPTLNEVGSSSQPEKCIYKMHGGNESSEAKQNKILSRSKSKNGKFENSEEKCSQKTMVSLTSKDKRGINQLLCSYSSQFLKEMVKCVIVRERQGIQRLYPVYKLFYQDSHALVMVAQKIVKSRTSNYHIFDMQRGLAGNTLSKKGGNYLGKVRSNYFRTESTIFTNDQEKEELGVVHFDKSGLMDNVVEGSVPRKFYVLIPPLDADGVPEPHKIDPFDPQGSLNELLRIRKTGRMLLLQTKDPELENGNYTLNFHGRVTVPSVKNYQLVSQDDTACIISQFGKVGEDTFHLDFQQPLSPFQAFAIALSQLNF